jgi:hypothetical protein
VKGSSHMFRVVGLNAPSGRFLILSFTNDLHVHRCCLSTILRVSAGFGKDPIGKTTDLVIIGSRSFEAAPVAGVCIRRRSGRASMAVGPPMRRLPPA